MKTAIESYRAKRMANTDLWRIENTEFVCPVAICIPICNENPLFFDTLDSLEESAAFYKKSSLLKIEDEPVLSVFCAINSNVNHKKEVHENNKSLLAFFENQEVVEHDTQSKQQEVGGTGIVFKRWPLLQLYIIDCTSEKKRMPENQGVGLARKIAGDSALCCGAKLLACLDADTLVSRNYAVSLIDFLGQNEGKTAAGSTNFLHQQGQNDGLEKAIRSYETFLHGHSESLKKAGFPFYKIALGPVIVCTVEAYCACNGMNLRIAGEDFYFLQSLEKVCLRSCSSGNSCLEISVESGMKQLDCTVYPSARISDRVLFGTGTKIKGIIDGTDNAVLYPSEIYLQIKQLVLFFRDYFREICEITDIASIKKGKKDGMRPRSKVLSQTQELFIFLQKKMQETNPALFDFLKSEKFFQIWPRIEHNTGKKQDKLESAFFYWFDGLKVIRLIHFLMR